MYFKGLFFGLLLLFVSAKPIIAEISNYSKLGHHELAINSCSSLVADFDSSSFNDELVCKFSLQSFTNSFIINFENWRGANKYEIRYATSTTGNKWKSVISAFSRIEISKLIANKTYYFQGRILNKSKWSDWSAIQSGKTSAFAAKVISYNVLSAIFDDVFPENIWDTRKKALVNLIKKPSNQPDIMGLQEVMDSIQLDYLQSSFRDLYEVHVSKRKISSRAIFWKKNKYKLVSFDDDIDLNVGFVKGASERYISCVRLREQYTNKEFLVFNVHLPSSYSSDKEAQRNDFARVLANKAIEMSSLVGDIPVVVLGDFNSLSLTHTKSKVTAPMIMNNFGFSDVFYEAVDRKNSEYATHDLITSGVSSSFSKSLGQSKRIDYIFTYPTNRVTVSEYKIVVDFEKYSGTILRRPIPSDHRPVSSILHFNY